MNRREVFKSLAGLPFVAGLTPVEPTAKALVLTFRDGYDTSGEGIRRAHESVRAVLDEVGLSDLKVIYLDGLDAVVV